MDQFTDDIPKFTEQDSFSPINHFRDFLRFIQFSQPNCRIIDWNTVQKVDAIGVRSYSGFQLVKIPHFPNILTMKVIQTIKWENNDDIDRLIQEIQTLCSCNHPNILPLHGILFK